MRDLRFGLLLLAATACSSTAPTSSTASAVSVTPASSTPVASPPTLDQAPPVYAVLRAPRMLLDEVEAMVAQEPLVASIVEACGLNVSGLERIDAAMVPPDALRVEVVGKGATATAVGCLVERLGLTDDLAIEPLAGGVRLMTAGGGEGEATRALALLAERSEDEAFAGARIGQAPPWTAELTIEGDEPSLSFRSTPQAARELQAWWRAAHAEKAGVVPAMNQLALDREGGTVHLRMVGDAWEDVSTSVAAALAIRQHVVESFNVPSASMVPSLVVGDHFFLDKTGRPPTRGDVVVFPYPDNPRQRFVKRLVAGPGDRLEVIDGRPIVNGKLLPHCHVGRLAIPDTAAPLEIYVEYLGERAYLTAYDAPPTTESCTGDADCQSPDSCRAGHCGLAQGPYQGADRAWVLGDNRNNSHDSRSFDGGRGAGIPTRAIQGRATLIYFHPTKTERALTSVDELRLPVADVRATTRLKACLADRPSLAETTPPPPR